MNLVLFMLAASLKGGLSILQERMARIDICDAKKSSTIINDRKQNKKWYILHAMIKPHETRRSYVSFWTDRLLWSCVLFPTVERAHRCCLLLPSLPGCSPLFTHAWNPSMPIASLLYKIAESKSNTEYQCTDRTAFHLQYSIFYP